jgi:threonine/homoserine/homoserine lactone efflux protein
MPADLLPALVALAIATLFTPGPNNAMLAASGARFGFLPTIPHLLGVATGFPLMMLVVGLLLGGIFQTSPLLREGLRWGGAVLLLWIAWKIARTGSLGRVGGQERPMRYLGAVAFQWVNPKAWSMAVGATAQFILPAAPVTTAGIVSAVFLGLGLISAMTWTYAGQAISRWLTTPARLRAFNLVMAALIVLSVVALIRH